ncbi:MAG TPA: hypothetical protein VHM91_18225 [Verrucomicrobiales bacterium]|jgi:hypothetical protein|nr:hypothetical protein [Verrucomicrobiales bacterium]
MHPTGNKALAGQVEGGRVVLSCRRGAADDITFYARREGESDFVPLEEDGERIVDDRPKLDPSRPEKRSYFAMLLYGGDETRMKSNEIIVTVP